MTHHGLAWTAEWKVVAKGRAEYEGNRTSGARTGEPWGKQRRIPPDSDGSGGWRCSTATATGRPPARYRGAVDTDILRTVEPWGKARRFSP